MQLDPLPPARYLIYLARAYGVLGRSDAAIELLTEVLERSPNNLYAHIGLTAAYSASGLEEEARNQAQELIRLDPTFSLDQYAEMVPIKDKAELERHIAGLRKAGLK